jgi:hypothetical protein
MTLSPLQTRLENRLHLDLEGWVLAGRADGWSWRALAKQLKALTGQSVTAQCLWLWYADKDPKRVTR